jgi:predicted ATP-grasp superfamily ATP-dependent carboligase
LPPDFPYPAVLKPIDGAGSQQTFLIPAAGDCPAGTRDLPVGLLQPLAPGVAMSASFLVGPDGRAHLIAAGRQHMEVCDGRFVYRGGTLPMEPRGVEAAARPAVESVPGLRGFVGVDYVWDEAAGRAVVLEINPRVTTSYVGLARLLPAGTLAGAWLGLMAAGSAAWGRVELPGASPGLAPRNSVTFAADGGMMEPGGGFPP